MFTGSAVGGAPFCNTKPSTRSDVPRRAPSGTCSRRARGATRHPDRFLGLREHLEVEPVQQNWVDAARAVHDAPTQRVAGPPADDIDHERAEALLSLAQRSVHDASYRTVRIGAGRPGHESTRRRLTGPEGDGIDTRLAVEPPSRYR